MQLLLLGTAAGGGFPQWNCWCPTCRAARSTPHLARPRTQSSLAVSADRERWFLFNVSPDVRTQIDRFSLPPLRAGAARSNPVEGMVLTDAELDHTLGLALLREGEEMRVVCTASVRRTLEEDSRLLPVTRAFARVGVTELGFGDAVPLRHRDGARSGLTVEAFPVPGDPPRFSAGDDAGHTIGVVVRDARSGGSFAFVPGCGALDESLLGRLATVDALFFDGTFWTEDELARLGISGRCASEMGHLPIAPPAGSLPRLAALPCRHKVYTHINNTNPVLLEESAERRTVVEAGLVVGMDGMAFVL